MSQQIENQDNNLKKNFEGSEFWNVRFEPETYAYGVEPNQFLKEKLDQLPLGNALFVAEGEGRNAVYAAQQGWQVDAVDFSIAAREKAKSLALYHGVEIDYHLADVTTFTTTKKFDLIALVFLHLSPDSRTKTFRSFIPFLKEGGRILVEIYHPDQLGRLSGGPSNIQYLVNENDLKTDFESLDIEHLARVERMLNEGPFHQGLACVTQFVGRKSS